MSKIKYLSSFYVNIWASSFSQRPLWALKVNNIHIDLSSAAELISSLTADKYMLRDRTIPRMCFTT